METTEQLPKVTTTKQKLIIAGIGLLILLLCGGSVWWYGKSQREAGKKEVTDAIALNKDIIASNAFTLIQKERTDTIKILNRKDSTIDAQSVKLKAKDTQIWALMNKNNKTQPQESPATQIKVLSVDTSYYSELLNNCASENNLLTEKLLHCATVKTIDAGVIIAADTLAKADKAVINDEKPVVKHPFFKAIARPFIYIGTVTEAVFASIGTYIVYQDIKKP